MVERDIEEIRYLTQVLKEINKIFSFENKFLAVITLSNTSKITQLLQRCMNILMTMASITDIHKILT